MSEALNVRRNRTLKDCLDHQWIRTSAGGINNMPEIVNIRTENYSFLKMNSSSRKTS